MIKYDTYVKQKITGVLPLSLQENNVSEKKNVSSCQGNVFTGQLYLQAVYLIYMSQKSRHVTSMETVSLLL